MVVSDWIDQTLLPNELKYVYCEDIKSLWHAIKTLMVRGAPAIGIAGAMGVVLGIKEIQAKDADAFLKELKRVTTYLGSSLQLQSTSFGDLPAWNVLHKSTRASPFMK